MSMVDHGMEMMQMIEIFLIIGFIFAILATTFGITYTILQIVNVRRHISIRLRKILECIIHACTASAFLCGIIILFILAIVDV